MTCIQIQFVRFRVFDISNRRQSPVKKFQQGSSWILTGTPTSNSGSSQVSQSDSGQGCNARKSDSSRKFQTGSEREKSGYWNGSSNASDSIRNYGDLILRINNILVHSIFFLLNFKIVHKLEKRYIENLKLKKSDSSYFCVADRPCQSLVFEMEFPGRLSISSAFTGISSRRV